MSYSITNKLTSRFRQILSVAYDLAVEMGHQDITPLHLLWGVLTQKGSVGSDIILRAGVSEEFLKSKISGLGFQNGSPDAAIKISPRLADDTKKIIKKAVAVAADLRHPYVSTEHLLAGLFNSDNAEINKIWLERKISVTGLKNSLNNILKTTSKFSEVTSYFSEKENTSGRKKDISQNLEPFTFELTSQHAQKNIDPVIGREAEIERIIQILCRRRKNNPLLLGEAGVGKTAIVEGLAKKIALGEVPDVLLNKKIYRLDLVKIIAGSQFRGEFENRIKHILEDIKNDPDIILFIDEIHTIIGAGGVPGSLDAANILKPALSRGEIKCIGATTFSEYKKSIESDPALERRFQVVKVNEPSIEETKKIIKGLACYYEKFHKVKITEGAITAAVDLSRKYIMDKFLPDKAIDLIDEAASRMKVSVEPQAIMAEIKQLEKQLTDLEARKKAAINEDSFEVAIQSKLEEDIIFERLIELKKEQGAKKIIYGQLVAGDIVKTLSGLLNIPLSELDISEKSRIFTLEQELLAKIIGQQEAIKDTIHIIKKSFAGLGRDERPFGSFMFLGPSGVGKTAAAIALSETLYGKNNLIRLDMSEFGEKFNVSRLLGAPAGYIGYGEGGRLTEEVRKKPNAVILFDEIEKAHPDVFNILLQILDNGILTDATGKEVNFRNCVIVMTSNLGTDNLYANQLGFENEGGGGKTNNAIDNQIERELKNSFKVELLNRLDKIIIFKHLGKEHLKTITCAQIEELNCRLENKKLKLVVSPAAIDFLVNYEFKIEQGARHIARNIANLLERELAEFILSGQSKEGVIRVEVKDNQLVLKSPAIVGVLKDLSRRKQCVSVLRPNSPNSSKV